MVTTDLAELMAAAVTEIGRWHLGLMQVQGADGRKLQRTGWEPLDLYKPPPKRVLTDPNEIAAALHRIMPGK